MLQFDNTGFLIPAEPIESNLINFESNFVFNERRGRLFNVYLDFLEELKKLNIGNYFQRIDGSFTTRKPFPNDIDIVNFVDFDFHKMKLSRLYALKNYYKSCGIDVYYEPFYPKNHILASTNTWQLDYWKEVYALGQFLLYKLALTKKEPNHVLYLAMPRDFYNDFFDDAFFLEVLKIYQVHIIIYDYKNSLIEQWIK